MRKSLLTSSLAIALVSAGFAGNDFQIGGPSAFGLGGAGLALLNNPVQNYRLNPAMLAYGPNSFQFSFPSVGVRLDGISVSDLRDNFGSITSGGISNDKLVSFSKTFGQRTIDVGADAQIGIYTNHLGIQLVGNGTASTVPNAALRAYNPNGGGAPADGSQLDAYGQAYSSINVGYAILKHKQEGAIAYGATAKFIHGYYAHKIVAYAGGNGSVANGSEMGGADTLDQTGVGVDLGAIYASSKVPGLTYGATILNAIRPNVKFNSQLPSDQGGGIVSNGADFFQTSFNIGMGYMPSHGLAFAADYIDVGNKTGQSSLAMGLQMNLGAAALEAGYNSRTAFSLGLNIAGFNIALQGRRPLVLGSVFRF